jgi:hypothetical protein
VAHGVHPARRPSGVLLLTRVTGFAGLDELRNGKLKPSDAKAKAKAKAEAISHARHAYSTQASCRAENNG